MGKFHVVEKFVSINGEARQAGALAAFIRFAGCNLNCSYCDTSWANEKKAPFDILSEEEIYAFIKDSGVYNVTLTGGEPLLQPNMDCLLAMLGKDPSLRIEIETNGSIDIAPFVNIPGNIVFTLDYKLPGSGMHEAMKVSNYRYLKQTDSVKFVVSDRQDLDYAREIIETYHLNDRATVYISSAFSQIEPAEIVSYMIAHQMNREKVQLQLHKYIWDPNRKGV